MKQILGRIIEKGYDKAEWTRFFREKNENCWKPRGADLSGYNTTDFTNGEKIGEYDFEAGKKIIISAFFSKKSLSERSGKLAQYKIGKDVLTGKGFDAGIFIFRDENNNFRFSYIETIYLGTRRDFSHFRRFTYFVGNDLTNKTFKQRIGDGNFSNLAGIKKSFSVEPVTEEFYESIANWYFWAVEHSQFPKDAEAEGNGRNIAVIRLITRMIFIWFMRERGLVPRDLFDNKTISERLNDLSQNESTYYKAILQNLFFATLSTPKNQRKFTDEKRFGKGYNEDFGNHSLFRYHEYFKNPEKLKDYFNEIPFLNGGLFECLDNKEERIYIDGFSRTKKNQPNVPNFLFFSEEQKVDLSKAYGTKSDTHKVRGLLNILSSFNFTIDENSPDDQEIALDPELLGRVFENLLASFNPETSTTARKATGSYYTPREIVDYMVAESLKAYFKIHLLGIESLDKKIDHLFSTGSEENPFNKAESKKIVELIERVRIVDPAVGSGAFPMGALNKLVFILNKVDPGNELWKQTQLSAADTIPDSCIRQDTKNRIEEFFKGKNADYGRKLYLIQKCIYGVDIQQIAVEIAKLRFFISLLVDEGIDKTKENWGIEPLPNLDFKIMQGNSLLEEYKGIKLFDERLIANVGFDKEKQVEELKKMQNNLSGEYIRFHQSGELSDVKRFELENELKNIKKTLDKLQNPSKEEVEASKQSFESINSESRIKAEQLKRLHKEFFETNEKETKNKIKKQIERIGWDLIEATLKEQNKTSELKKIEQFKKSNTKPFFLWKLHFADVFENGGFDIVIGNPPYVRADSPNFKAQREAIMQSTLYETLYEKWDLFLPFIERGLKLLSATGNLSYITSNSLLTSKFAFRLLEFIQKNYAAQYIDYFSDDTKVFEAGVVPVVFGIAKKAVNPKVRKTIHQGEFNHIIRQEIVPIADFKALGREAFKLSTNSFKSTAKIIPLSDVCYLSYGLRPNSDERFWKGEFTRDDLVSDIKDKEHPLQYIEGKNLDYYRVNNVLYLEWGTDRVPKKLVRQTFPGLYDRPKIMRGRVTGGIYDDTGLVCNDSIVVFVRFIDLAGVENRSISGSLKKFNSLPRTDLERISTRFNLKYLLAILNSKFANNFLNNIRRHRLENYFYPDDFRKLPIADIPSKDQKPFIEIVDKILAITKSGDYLENPAKKEEVRKYETQIDTLVYKLYGLNAEEIKIVEGAGDRGERKTDHEMDCPD